MTVPAAVGRRDVAPGRERPDSAAIPPSRRLASSAPRRSGGFIRGRPVTGCPRYRTTVGARRRGGGRPRARPAGSRPGRSAGTGSPRSCPSTPHQVAGWFCPFLDPAPASDAVCRCTPARTANLARRGPPTGPPPRRRGAGCRGTAPAHPHFGSAANGCAARGRGAMVILRGGADQRVVQPTSARRPPFRAPAKARPPRRSSCFFRPHCAFTIARVGSGGVERDHDRSVNAVLAVEFARDPVPVGCAKGAGRPLPEGG